MSIIRTVVRSAAAAALVAGVIATPSSALASSSQQFSAHSGDSCRYGQTSGQLSWVNPLPHPSVTVKGTLADRPVPTDPITTCKDDRRYSTVTFTAYSGTRIVAKKQQQSDNQRVQFSIALTSATNQSIDRVVVQVCRASASPNISSYCGTPVSYPRLITTL